MLFRQIKEEDGWMVVDYSATWKYGYDLMLDLCQVIIDTDFQNNLQRIATTQVPGGEPAECLENVKQCDFDLRKCDATSKESSALIIAGISRVMQCPIQMMFFNQTNVVRLFCPIKKIFEDHGEHVFDNYVNSIEIRAYCRDAIRQSKETKDK